MRQWNQESTENQRCFPVDTSPLRCALREIVPLRVECVSKGEQEELWDFLVREYHYLSHRMMVGCRLKYLVFHKQRPIAALGWRAAALKLKVRDCFIGWSDEQRKSHLKQIANNNRFLILPWVVVPCLASHLLSKNIKRLPADWYETYRQKLLLLETFVDGTRFSGTCYKASNWIHAGQTKGYTKRAAGYVYHGQKKEVYLYVVEPRFRQIIGCQQRPLSQWSPKITQGERELKMILRHASWNPEVVPWMELRGEDMEGIAEELVGFHEQFSHYYGRREHHRLGLAYLRGLLSNLGRKTAEGIALLLMEPGSVRDQQRFITNYIWDHEGMLQQYQRSLSELICFSDGMINVDSSEFVKKGSESVGVARQYCGNIGKVENCQSGVFVGYASRKGYGLVDCQLYLPRPWFGQEYAGRRKKCQIPEGTRFQTKIEIALSLIQGVRDSGLFAARWLGCDATFGSAYRFLDEVGRYYWYFANVRSDTQVWLQRPRVGVPPYSGRGRPSIRPKVLDENHKPVTVAEIGKNPELQWTKSKLEEGAKGPIIAEVTRVRVIESREGMPGKERWLFIRKYPDGKMKLAMSNAPKNISLQKMIKASTKRWPIEQCFEEGKENLGMDHYEHRSWPGWHRHMLFVFLAQLFLLRLRYRFKKNSSLNTATSSTAGFGGNN